MVHKSQQMKHRQFSVPSSDAGAADGTPHPEVRPRQSGAGDRQAMGASQWWGPTTLACDLSHTRLVSLRPGGGQTRPCGTCRPEGQHAGAKWRVSRRFG